MTNDQAPMTNRAVSDSLVIGIWSLVILSWIDSDFGLLRCRFARLDLYKLTLVADTLAFVGLGLAERSQLGGELTDLLLVWALDDDVGVVGASHREAGGNL